MHKAHRQNIYGGPYMALLGAFRDSGGKGGLGLRAALNLEGAADAGRLCRRAPPAGYGGLLL